MRGWLLAVSMVAAPAGAQFAPSIRPSPPPVPVPEASTWRDVRDLRERADRGREAGQVSRKEARRLKRAAGGLGAAASRYGRDGMTADEERELAVRARVLHEQVLAARSGVRPVPRVGAAPIASGGR